MRFRARIVLPLLVLVCAAGSLPASAAGPSDWPAYLFSAIHTSKNPASTSITPSNASGVAQAWTWTPPTVAGRDAPRIDATPVVYGGRVYVGTRSGWFYAIDVTSGSVLWKRDTGYVQACTGNTSKMGISSTASVVVDPVDGVPTVYVAGGLAAGGAGGTKLFAFNATTGTVRWSRVVDSQAGSYAWSSPTVIAGHVYLGISSACDQPLIRGGVVEVDQHTGSILHRYWTVPSGTNGGSVWSSVTSSTDGSNLWVTTGNEGTGFGDSDAIVRLDGSTLVKRERWTIPAAQRVTDGDFGGTPVPFAATIGGTRTLLVGACNKNGIFYVWRRQSLAAGPVWQVRIGGPAGGGNSCLAAGVWDAANAHLFIAGNRTTIAGTSYLGSVRQVNPATGAFVWERGLPGVVLGTPALNGSGVLAAATYDGTAANNAAYLIDASTGAVRKTIDIGGQKVFGQPVFADPYLLIATSTGGLRAYRA
jgi:outer membrane protein assembly factor BamB